MEDTPRDMSSSYSSNRHSRSAYYDNLESNYPTGFYNHKDDSYSSASTYSFWHRLMRILDFVTSVYFGVIVAIVVIVCIHYKDGIQDFVWNLMEHGVQETVTDYFFAICDLVRAYYQMFCEVLRGILNVDSSKQHNNSILGVVMNSARDRIPSGNGSTKKNELAFLPPLVIVEDDSSSLLTSEGQEHHQYSSSSSSSNEHDQHGPSHESSSRRAFSSSECSSSFSSSNIQKGDIEPAFLNDEDYPKGWLVYHPTLGVISKEEADEIEKNKTISIDSKK